MARWLYRRNDASSKVGMRSLVSLAPIHATMPVYVCETISQSDAHVPHTFELRQSMSEPCLTVHPDTGVPVRRVLSGGLATFTGPAAATPMRGGGGCGSTCGCA
jgi:predicted nucleic acid-binding Zn ribbon protein